MFNSLSIRRRYVYCWRNAFRWKILWSTIHGWYGRVLGFMLLVHSFAHFSNCWLRNGSFLHIWVSWKYFSFILLTWSLCSYTSWIIVNCYFNGRLQCSWSRHYKIRVWFIKINNWYISHGANLGYFGISWMGRICPLLNRWDNRVHYASHRHSDV